LKHVKSSTDGIIDLSEFRLPMTFCNPRKARLRLAGDSVGGDTTIWEMRENSWGNFWRSQGKEKLAQSGKVAVNGLLLAFFPS
jgi:trafficking protein particle complex subunit 8